MNNKANKIIAYGIRIVLILAGIASILSQNWLNLFTIVLTLALTYLPNILTRQWNIYLPENLQLVIIVFVFSANYLGELNDFYYKFPWWDDMLHSISGATLGIIGYLLTDSLNRYDIKNVRFELSPFFVAFFAFIFSVAAGAVWEIFEYLMDVFFGTDMQKYMIDPQIAVAKGFGITWQGPGLVDTMHDLILDSLGGLVISIIGYIRLKAENKKYRGLKNAEKDSNADAISSISDDCQETIEQKENSEEVTCTSDGQKDNIEEINCISDEQRDNIEGNSNIIDGQKENGEKTSAINKKDSSGEISVIGKKDNDESNIK